MVNLRHEIAASASLEAKGEPTRGPTEWRISEGLVAYDDAISAMEAHVAAIRNDYAPGRVWLLQHPPLYTAGTSAKDTDLLAPERFPVHRTGRGGQYTYHGPGQRVAYVMLDLKARIPDLRLFVAQLEQWVIASLKRLGVKGERREDRVGVWVKRPDLGETREDKIAAIGIRVRHWVSYHGISLNVAPNLEHYSGIIPCGIEGHGVTSLTDLGIKASMDEVDDILHQEFVKIFGPVTLGPVT